MYEKERVEGKVVEQYYEALLRCIPADIAVVRRDSMGRFIPEFLSDGFLEMTGMSEETMRKLRYRDTLDGVHSDERDYVKENLEQCLEEKKNSCELRYRVKKGESDYIWVSAKYSLFRDEGKGEYIFINYYDITAEEEQQEQLRQKYREQILQHYLLNDDDILVLGHCNITQNKILDMVDRADMGLLDKFGSLREDFFKGVGTLIPDQREREEFYGKYLNEPSLRAFNNGVKEVLMACYIELPGKKEGKYVQFQVDLVSVPDTGDVTGILTVTDVTEKKIQNTVFSRLSEINYDLVVEVDLIRNTYTIVSGEDWDDSEMEGDFLKRVERVREKVVSDDRELFWEMISPGKILQHLEGRKSYSFTYSCKNKDGMLTTKSMAVTSIDSRLKRICMVRSDVTEMLAAERKEKEELERALSAAEKASRVKSNFLSSMSHDIRTPMNAIIGMTTLALRNIDNKEKVQDYLKKISISSHHLLSLINDILDMNQLECAHMKLDHSCLHLEELLNHLSSIMLPQAQYTGLDFQIERKNIRHPYFMGDPLRLRQIFINLLSNAFKFTAEGGNVWLRVEEIQALKEGRVRYRFCVQDTGIGMSETFVKHLFKPFVRARKVSEIEGTGLGLSITKGLVDLMGGQISVESRQKEGTIFYVELEFEEADRRTVEVNITQPEDDKEQNLKGRHFLMVEDNEINAEILGELLRMWGAGFTVKKDGFQAVEEFKNSKPGTYDMIFMDVQMPVMNGYEAARAIRSLPRQDAKDIIIVAMTANAFAEDVQLALDSGMNQHIAKPLDARKLYLTISQLLNEREERE